MRPEQWTRILSITALVVAAVALVVAGRALMVQQDHRRDMEALGELIRRSSSSGRPVMDMGPPGGGRSELDLGE